MTHSNWIRGALSVLAAMGIFLSNAPLRRTVAAPMTVPLIDVCFVDSDGDNVTNDQSPDSGALQTALAAASAGAVIKVAGHCAGSMGGQTALVDKAVTLRGGYTTTNWVTSDPAAYPTRLDALYDGYVVKATAPVTLENLILQNGFSNSGAGAKFDAAALVLSTTFTNNVAIGDGGGLYAGSSIVMISSTIVSNTANIGGGAYFAAAAVLTGTSFLSNTAASRSAAEMSATGPTVSVMVRSVVQGNVTTGSSGGVLGSAAALTIESSRVASNAVTGSSGSGLIYIGGDAVISGTVIERNAVTGVTGGVSVQGALTMRNAQILSNTLVGDGTLNTAAAADIADSRFAGNVVSGQGGAIDASGVTTLTNVSIISNTAGGDGGGARFGSRAVVQGGEVLSNVSTAGNGGGLYWGKTDLRISGTLVAGNAVLSDTRNGGGAYAGGAAFVENSRFERNAGAGDGAALYGEQSVRITTSTFLSNTTVLTNAYAGAVNSQSTLYITGSTFVSNTNVRGYAGAASGATFVVVHRSIFTGNVGGEGGAILSRGDAEVHDSIFDGNVAARSNGGALTSRGALTSTTSTFSHNSTAGHGGAVYAGGGGLLNRSLMLHNDATLDGGGAYYAGDVEATNNVFAANSAGEAGDLYFSAGLRGSHNTFSGTGTALAIGGIAAPAVGVLTNTLMAGYTIAADADTTGTIELRGLLWDGGAFATSGTVTVTQRVTGSARFVGPGVDSYVALGAGVDAGVDSGVAEDIRGNARPQGAGYDLGAYEVGSEVLDASLSDLMIAPGTLAPAFVSSTTSYTASVGNEVTTVRITPTVNVDGATYVVSSAPGACSPTTEPAACGLSPGRNVVTVLVTSLNGAVVQTYTVEIVRASGGSLTTIGRVWPTLGVPEGGMPVTLFGSGFAVATGVRVSNAITNALVPFSVTGDGRIDFVMPAGADGTWADISVETAAGSTTASQAFWYQAPVRLEIDGQTGAVITLTGGVVIVVPAQGMSGTFVITLTPLVPEPGLPGDLLLHVFQLETLSVTAPITIVLPVDVTIVPVGQQPWLYQWTSGGQWVVVREQHYSAGASDMKVAVKPTGTYALSTVSMRTLWLPVAPVHR